MTLNAKRTAAVFCAAILSLSLLSACSDSSESKESKADNNSKAEAGDQQDAASGGKNSDSKLDIYLSEDGIPYYYDADGNIMEILVSEEYGFEEDYTENYIYEHFEENGYSFDIPSGWYADNSFLYPIMFVDTGEDGFNYDQNIMIAPSYEAFEAEIDDEINESLIKGYFDMLVEDQYYTEYEITDSGKEKVGDIDADYYIITAAYELLGDEMEDSEKVTVRMKYIVTNGSDSHCIMLNSLDDDDSFAFVVDAYNSIAASIVLPAYDDMQEEPDDFFTAF